MAAYKEPGFQERVAAAARAKRSALDSLRARPPVDEATRAEQVLRREAREAVAAQKREAARLAREEAHAAVNRQAEQSEVAPTAAEPRVRTEAELKAARDVRYAARKSRKP